MPTAECRAVTVDSVVEEAEGIFTLRYLDGTSAYPGQFVMVWVPGKDQLPMSLSYTGNVKGFTFKVLGEGTDALSRMSVGDVIGVSAPLGRGYDITGGETFVAGGTGMASVAPAVERSLSFGSPVRVYAGARTSGELFFVGRLKGAGAEVRISTDDGSAGEKGFVTALFEKELSFHRRVVTCGPEVMMARVVKMCLESGVHVQASLERYMKCGVGVCDACNCGGALVCRDGPVFDGRRLGLLEDFGRFKRDASGRRIPL